MESETTMQVDVRELTWLIKFDLPVIRRLLRLLDSYETGLGESHGLGHGVMEVLPSKPTFET